MSLFSKIPIVFDSATEFIRAFFDGEFSIIYLNANDVQESLYTSLSESFVNNYVGEDTILDYNSTFHPDGLVPCLVDKQGNILYCFETLPYPAVDLDLFDSEDKDFSGNDFVTKKVISLCFVPIDDFIQDINENYLKYMSRSSHLYMDGLESICFESLKLVDSSEISCNSLLKFEHPFFYNKALCSAFYSAKINSITLESCELDDYFLENVDYLEDYSDERIFIHELFVGCKSCYIGDFSCEIYRDFYTEAVGCSLYSEGWSSQTGDYIFDTDYWFSVLCGFFDIASPCGIRNQKYIPYDSTNEDLCEYICWDMDTNEYYFVMSGEPISCQDYFGDEDILNSGQCCDYVSFEDVNVAFTSVVGRLPFRIKLTLKVDYDIDLIVKEPFGSYSVKRISAWNRYNVYYRGSVCFPQWVLRPTNITVSYIGYCGDLLSENTFVYGSKIGVIEEVLSNLIVPKYEEYFSDYISNIDFDEL